jgi:hypothetical protein
MDGQVEVKKVKALPTNKIPADILTDPVLNEVVKTLPDNYNFEIHKSLWRIREVKQALGKEVYFG